MRSSRGIELPVAVEQLLQFESRGKARRWWQRSNARQRLGLRRSVVLLELFDSMIDHLGDILLVVTFER